MNTLTRTRSILHRGNTHDGRVFFAHDEEPYSKLISIDVDLWEDLGRPDVITVTVEPGDLLN